MFYKDNLTFILLFLIQIIARLRGGPKNVLDCDLFKDDKIKLAL